MSTIKLCKLPTGKKATKGAAHKTAKTTDPVTGDFVLTVGVDGSFTVFGTDGTTQPDGSPTQIDLSAVATMTASSADPSKVTVSTSGMSGVESPVAAGTGIAVTVVVTITASGQVFTAIDTVDVVPAPPPPPPPVTGLIIVHNPPTIA
jgi:hypothetical protein